MSFLKEDPMTTEKTTGEDMCRCPVGTFFQDVENIFGRKSKFIDHMTRSRIEVLKAVRSLVDERIEDLDRKKSKRVKKRATRVNVE